MLVSHLWYPAIGQLVSSHQWFYLNTQQNHQETVKFLKTANFLVKREKHAIHIFSFFILKEVKCKIHSHISSWTPLPSARGLYQPAFMTIKKHLSQLTSSGKGSSLLVVIVPRWSHPFISADSVLGRDLNCSGPREPCICAHAMRVWSHRLYLNDPIHSTQLLEPHLQTPSTD